MKFKTLISIILIMFLSLIITSCSTMEEVNIKAGVRLVGSGPNQTIRITNNDNFDWGDVRLGINADGFTVASGYVYRFRVIRSGQTVAINVRNFTDGSDSKRFNPLTTKIQNFRIAVWEPDWDEDKFADELYEYN